MAFRSSKRKEFKKCSYYVWFLGAKESKGLRGEEFIIPVVQPALEREKEMEPMKVTLQLSHKGMKIVQTVPKKGNNRNKTEQVKHFIPHNAITCVQQLDHPDDDVVSCILLIYNPLTKCPVHVHTYRCDSPQTAMKLSEQLQMLVSRPENQKKFREIENRLAAKGLLPGLRGVHRQATINSDGRSTRTDDSSDSGGGHGSDKEPSPPVLPSEISSLYDSLAAELRQKLGGKNNVPLLLPPKDYDTVCRKQGKLMNINNRRSQQVSVVGPMAILPKVERDPGFTSDKERGDGSGKSSGIGSDEALSSAIQEVSSHPDFENKIIDPDTSSDDDDDWAVEEVDSDEPPIVQQPVARDEVFVQKSWRRPPPMNKKPSLPTYHYSEVDAVAHRGTPKYSQDTDRRKDDEIAHRPTYSSIDFRDEDRRFVMYPDNEPSRRTEELRPVYLSREEYKRLEQQRRDEASRRMHDEPRRRDLGSRYIEDEDPRYREYPSQRKSEYSDNDEDGIRRRSELKNDSRYRHVPQKEAPPERPRFTRNKSATRVPDHYRHSHVERVHSDDRPKSGYEIRHSNSLHHLNAPKVANRSRYPEHDSQPSPTRRLVHSSTLERFPQTHDKYHQPAEIPGLVDPRRKSLNMDSRPGYRGSYVEPVYPNRSSAGPRYTVTAAQKF